MEMALSAENGKEEMKLEAFVVDKIANIQNIYPELLNRSLCIYIMFGSVKFAGRKVDQR